MCSKTFGKVFEVCVQQTAAKRFLPFYHSLRQQLTSRVSDMSLHNTSKTCASPRGGIHACHLRGMTATFWSDWADLTEMPRMMTGPPSGQKQVKTQREMHGCQERTVKRKTTRFCQLGSCPNRGLRTPVPQVACTEPLAEQFLLAADAWLLIQGTEVPKYRHVNDALVREEVEVQLDDVGNDRQVKPLRVWMTSGSGFREHETCHWQVRLALSSAHLKLRSH